MLSVNIEKKNLDKSNNLIAKYLVETNDPNKSLFDISFDIAIGQSIGNPYSRNQYETSNLVKEFAAKIVSDIDYLKANKSGVIEIAFPLILYDIKNDGISQLLCTLMGGQMDIDHIEKCRLIDISFPNEYLKYFKKNTWGFKKTREFTSSFNKPLLGSIIKPKTGLNSDQLLDMTKQLVDGGVNFIKEDEILANPESIRLEKRIETISNYLSKSNSKIIFCHCINGDHHVILNRAKLVHELGGNGIHVNFWAGFGVYNSINQIDLPLFIHFQKSGDKVITGKKNPYGIDWKVICKLAVISGVDSIHIGMIGGYLNEDPNEMIDIGNYLNEHDTIPALSCGLTKDHIEEINYKFGVNYLANAGASIHSNEKGSKQGAIELRNKIDSLAKN